MSRIHTLCFFLLWSLPLEVFSQAKDQEEGRQRLDDFAPKDSGRSINLKMVLEQGLRENPNEKIRKYSHFIIENKEKDQNHAFWFPNLSLQIQSSKQNIHRFYSEGDSSTTKHPQGSLGLVIDDYTVFNWGKDYLKYLNEKGNLRRERENLEEKRRELKFQLMAQYFSLIKTRALERLNREHLRHSSFIYRFNQERIGLGKISQAEFFQARSLFLKNQRFYHRSMETTHETNKNLAYSLGDELSTLYHSQEELLFKEVSLTLEKTLALSKNHSVLIKDKSTQLENAKRDYEITIKENFPLPRFHINLGSYLHTLDETQSYTGYSTGPIPGGKNLELMASINLTWNIWGAGGFFNSRKNETSFYQRSIAETDYQNALKLTEKNIRVLYKQIKQKEEEVKIARPWLENAQRKFDMVMDGYLKGKTSFLHFKEAIDDLKDAEEYFQESKLDHLLLKLSLAREIGIEDFPGENFETLVAGGE